MPLLRVLLVVLAAVIATSMATATAGNRSSECTTPRVRRAWRMLSTSDKQVYQDALTATIASGEFIEFSKVHENYLSKVQAHYSCAFLIWHKRFVLAFENMLRAQGPSSRCITVPYWDVMTEYAQMVNGACASIDDCSAIVRELGASGQPPLATPVVKTVTINGRTTRGTCARMCSSYCDDAGTTCGCVPRADLTQVRIPSSAGFQGLFEIIAFSSSFEDFSRALQVGLHNEVHDHMGGFMPTYGSPSDPIFFSWHSTIDLLLYIYHQCHLADGLSAHEMQSSVYAFSQDGECRYRKDAPPVLLASDLIQRSTVEGSLVDADAHPVIGKYFVGVSSHISDLLGFATLGSHSYTYEVPDAFKKYLLLRKDKCPAFAEAARTDHDGGDGEEEEEEEEEEKKKGEEEEGTAAGEHYSYSYSDSKVNVTVNIEYGPLGSESDDVAVVAPHKANGHGHAAKSSVSRSVTRRAVHINPALSRVNDHDASIHAHKYWHWVHTTEAQLGVVFPGNHSEITRQMQLLECLSFYEQFGIPRYTPAFLTGFQLPDDAKPMCLVKVEGLASGEEQVALEVHKFKANAVRLKAGLTAS